MNFKNPHNHVVQLKGPNNNIIIIKPGQIIDLPPFFKKYCPKFLSVIKNVSLKKVNKITKTPTVQKVSKPKTKLNPKIKTQKTTKKISNNNKQPIKYSNPKVNKIDSIGVGILSFNRLKIIQRLLESIERFTDDDLFICVSDESTNKKVKNYLRSVEWIKLIDNDNRLGVAGNTNRVFKELSEFDYAIILNDDVEIIKKNWQYIYPSAMVDLGYHHFSYQQEKLFSGAGSKSTIVNSKGYSIKTINERPQGAVMAYSKTAFDIVGYFDTTFGIYGMEHVDWSNRVSMSKIQAPGFHDVVHARDYFRTHNERSAVDRKSKLLNTAKHKYKSLKHNKNRIYING